MVDSSVLASGGRYTREVNDFLFSIALMKPGAWCE
jgi:hypothetical protein